MKKVVGYPLPLGVSENNGIVNFSIAVESGKKCSLCIYKKGEDAPALEVELPEEEPIPVEKRKRRINIHFILMIKTIKIFKNMKENNII